MQICIIQHTLAHSVLFENRNLFGLRTCRIPDVFHEQKEGGERWLELPYPTKAAEIFVCVKMYIAVAACIVAKLPVSE